MLIEINFLTLIIVRGFRDKQFSRWDFSFSVIASSRSHRSNCCKMVIKIYFHISFAVDGDDDGGLGTELDMKRLYD